MPSPTHFVLDGTAGVAPRRASPDDLGGYAKEDDQAYPPDPVTMLAAADWNQMARLVAALGRVAPIALITIAHNGAGVPYVKRFVTASTTVTAANFTITDLGVGQTRVAWSAAALPPPTMPPMVSALGGADVYHTLVSADESAGWAEIVTLNAAKGYVDSPFVIALY